MPNSETVWFEEVDRGLLKFLKENIQTPIDGVLSPVYVEVKKSDEDFKVDVYPSISIYCTSYNHDKSRETTLKEVITEVDRENNIGKLEEAPKPYKFSYKITLWSELQTQMNYMSRMILDRIGQFHNLEVFDVSGNPTTVFMELKNPIGKGDMLTKNARILQTVFNYEIWVDIDEHTQTDVPVVTVSPRVETKVEKEKSISDVNISIKSF